MAVVILSAPSNQDLSIEHKSRCVGTSDGVNASHAAPFPGGAILGVRGSWRGDQSSRRPQDPASGQQCRRMHVAG